MDIQGEIERLIEQVRSLEDRVRELECSAVDERSPLIGFVQEPVGEDFDEDDPEYQSVPAPRGMLKSSSLPGDYDFAE